MRKKTLFTLETPYREPLELRAVEFGLENAEPCCAIVGSMRGNEIQQTFICAELIRRLQAMEARGMLDSRKRVVVIPSVNAFSMNISKRFWAVDNTDINRMFPGYDAGETTQRIADGLFREVKDYAHGIQLASYYLPGDFLPHVRITEVGDISQRSLKMADAFGFPYVSTKKPGSFDTTILNYNWQVWDTHAFSLFTRKTDSIDEGEAAFVIDCILRFLHEIGVVHQAVPGGFISTYVDEESLVNVRTCHAGGFFMSKVEPGRSVEAGEVLGEVLDSLDAMPKEALVCPVNGRVFFKHTAPLINQYTIAFKIVPEIM